MKGLFNVDRFISERITGRKQSLLAEDFQVHHQGLKEKIQGRNCIGDWWSRHYRVFLH